MSCPMYIDLTRECADKFEEIVNISNFNFCESGRYKLCPFYRNIHEPEKRCEYDDICMKDLTIRETPFEQIMEGSNKYCFTENRVNCERFKLISAGKTVPEGLLPDGSKIELEVEK